MKEEEMQYLGASGCMRKIDFPKRIIIKSFDRKVPAEAPSVDPLSLSTNVTALLNKLLIALLSNIFSFSLLHWPLFHFYGEHELPFADYKSKC